MPRHWTEYDLRDWSRLRPVSHVWKQFRYRRIDRRGLESARPNAVDADLLERLRDRRVLIVIAFNDVEAIEIQSTLIAQHVDNTEYLVVDNSSDRACRLAIAEHCRKCDIPYRAVPFNPWTGRNPSRSHGFAMNWTWRYVLLPSRPKQFGFIDHDLFPTQHCAPFQQLDGRICAGDLRWTEDRWYLWAGYCFFQFAQVEHLQLDFGLDWFAGLDTGGANWDVLYRNVDRASVVQRPIEKQQALPESTVHECYFEMRGEWLHEVGLAGLRELQLEKRKRIKCLLGLVDHPHMAMARSNCSG